MSEKSWYKRKHQFTPYTKADGQAVSDEFDAIQTSFERIPEMRDDGKGFKESPLIPDPTNPQHPVPLKILTQTENSVNNARDDVTQKAQQVAQNTQTTANNTAIASNKAAEANQAADTALSASRSAASANDMARKWASNPVDQVVLDNKYSAYHYATRAQQSEQNSASSESSALQSKADAQQSAETATSKAQEAKEHADRAKRIAGGKVPWNDVENIPSGNTTKKGIVQTTNSLESDSEELALTAKAGKLLKWFIDSITRNLENYIPNSKKSSAVNSNSDDTVATSVAVKNAYDKGVEAKNAADNAQRSADDGIGRANNAQLSANAAQRTANDGVSRANAANDNANGRVLKSGDSLTGILHAVGITSSQSGFGSYDQQYTSGAPFLVDATGSRDRDTYHPFVKGLVRSKGHYGAGFSFGYTTKLGVGDGFGQGIIQLIEDNGTSKLWIFEHNGNFNSPGDVRSSGGRSLNNAAQLSDFVYQKIGNFEVRKYPDGTMIQTYFVDFNDVGGANSGIGGTGQKQLTWAVSFNGKPLVWGNITSSLEDGHDVGVNILTKSTGTTLYWYNYEHSNFNQGACRLQFLAIGRWK